EKHPKDYLGVEVGASHPMYLGAWKLRAGYTAAYKAYSDSFLRTNQGAITPTKRADLLHRLELGGASGAPAGWTYGADLDGRFNASNSTVYDVNQPVRPYITHFNQFVSGQLAPWSAWALPFGAELHPKVRVTGLSMVRWYTNRFRQNDRGEYQGAKQLELEYGLDVRGWYPFAKWISAT